MDYTEKITLDIFLRSRSLKSKNKKDLTKDEKKALVALRK